MLDFSNLSFFKKLVVCIVVICVVPLVSVAQSNTGTIAGTVVDAKTGETVIGANVTITGTTKGTATDLDGSYTIRGLESGTYSISISYISYAKKTITGIEVAPGETTTLDISLRPKTVDMEEVTVTAQANQSSEAGLLAIQRKSVPVQDGLSSEQLSKIGDGDVGGAMKRVTGVTVRNGKDVYVRGLGNRYSNIQLNGAQVPSTDPNKKEAPTDMFGSGLIESIMVQKTYTADQLGEFSGGSVKIVTKEFPYERNFSASYSTSVNMISTFENTLTSKGSDTDFLGYDDGKRKLPGILDNRRADGDIAGQLVEGLHNDWNTDRSKKAIPSQSVSVNYANKFNKDQIPIGIVSNFSYKFSRELESNIEERFIQFFDEEGKPDYNTDYEKNQGIESAELSGMLNVFAKPSSVTKIGLKTLYSNSSTDTQTLVQGPALNSTNRQTVSDFDQRNVFATTLEAETYFENFLSSTLTGNVSYNRAMRIRPDRRNTRYSLLGDRYAFSGFGDNNGHFFSDQKDNNYSAEIKYELQPFDFLSVSAGGNAIIKDRSFRARRISYRDQRAPYLSSKQDLRYASPEVVLSDQNIASGLVEITETTQFNNDWYDGYQEIYAGFISTKWNLLDNLSFEIGGRVEKSTQYIEVPQSLDGDYEEVSRVANTDFLPAVNVNYSLAERTNIRLAYSRTLARPAFREISNFAFADYLGGQRVYGNPDLKQTNITNYDIRFETYPTGGQLFAISAFYKQFESPIEKFYRLTESNEVFFDNAPEADLYGIEIEGRKNVTERLQLVANASYIFSESRMDESASSRVANVERPMVGQSPYIINASAFYVLPEWNMNFSMSYNTFGERIVTVGKSLQGYDEYEQAFHDLGAKVEYDLGRADLSLEANNLLNDAQEYTMGGENTYYFEPGMSFKLGVTMSF